MKRAHAGRHRIFPFLPLAAILAAGAAMSPAAQAQPVAEAQTAEALGPTTSFNQELRLSTVFRTARGLDPTSGIQLDFVHYSTDRLHDMQHRSLSAEEIAGPLTYIRASAAFQPNQDFVIADRGITLGTEVIKAVGGPWGLGGGVTYSRIELVGDGILTDIEIGPQLAYWTSRRTFLTFRAAYRRVEPGSNGDGTFDDFVQLRNHVTYAAAEEWNFTYSQDVSFRFGLRDSPHTNALRIDNTFLFSPSSRFSWGTKVGVDLSFFVEDNTSLITIPIGMRAELFPTASTVITADVLYNLPTMIDQQTGGVSISGGLGFRF